MWLLEENTLRALVAAQKMPLSADAIAAYKAWEEAEGKRASAACGRCPTCKSRASTAADPSARTPEPSAQAGDCDPYILSRGANEATIRVEGVLTNRRNFYSSYYGGGSCSYQDIQRALSLCEQDPAIKRIMLLIDSPGGAIVGLFETIAEIQSVSKPITARVTQAQSAAYAIAAVAGRIEATSPAAPFGSIGVVMDTFVWPEEVSITNTDSPAKRPDLTTEEGKAVVRKELDAIYELFVEAIAGGRSQQTKSKVTMTEVRENYGRGSTLVAVDARKRGMIDAVVGKPMLRAVSRPRAEGEPLEENEPGSEPGAMTPAAPAAAVTTPAPAAAAATTTPASSSSAPKDSNPPAATSGTNGAAAGGPKEKRTMNLEKLKAEHPELYQAVLQAGIDQGVKTGIDQGVGQERKRCLAHLKMAKSTGAVDVAHKAIESGASLLDEDVHADYLSAGLNRNAQAARQTETTGAAQVVEGAPAAGAAGAAQPAADLGDAVVAILDKGKPKAAKKETAA